MGRGSIGGWEGRPVACFDGLWPKATMQAVKVREPVMKTATAAKAARKPVAAKASKPMMSPAFFRVMDEMLEQQRRDRRKLARQLEKQAA